eukprot:1323433-Pleurochrysis_carterae.AAC.3
MAVSEARLHADGALPTKAVAPRAKPKTFKQLGTPTVDAEDRLSYFHVGIVAAHRLLHGWYGLIGGRPPYARFQLIFTVHIY